MHLPQIIKPESCRCLWTDGRTIPQFSMNHRAPGEPSTPASHQPWPGSRIPDSTNGTRPRYALKPREKSPLQSLNGRKNRQTRDRPISTVLSSPRLPSPPILPQAGPHIHPQFLLGTCILACRRALKAIMARWHGAPRSFSVLSISRTLEVACLAAADMVPLQTVPGPDIKGGILPGR